LKSQILKNFAIIAKLGKKIALKTPINRLKINKKHKNHLGK